MTDTNTLLRGMRAALAGVVASDPQGAAQSDSELLESTELLEDLCRQAGVVQARRAAEIDRRSRHDLGRAGLASQRGHVNAPALLRSITRSSFAEAARRIRVGTVLNNAAAAKLQSELSGAAAEPGAATDPSSTGAPGSPTTDLPIEPALEPAFALIASAVTEGALGLEAADKVMRTLEPVLSDLNTDQLTSATATLLAEGATKDTDEVGVMARGIRDTLDRAGVPDREEFLRSRRSMKRGMVRDGLRQVSLVLDPESDVLLMGAIEQIMSPRLGGPRFADPAAQEAAQKLIDDPRTNDQIRLDTLVDLVTAGVNADPSVMPASGTPVRVTMTVEDLIEKVSTVGAELGGREEASDDNLTADLSGVAALEGHPELVSAATARRFLCNNGALPVVLGGDSVPLDLGRTRRLFSPAQRIALALRDRGCRWPECDRPPSWTESHHIDEYQHGGKTDLIDGIALCRRHHLLLHNNGWQILRHNSGNLVHSSSRSAPQSLHSRGLESPGFWLRPPRDYDRAQKLIPMPANGTPLLQRH